MQPRGPASICKHVAPCRPAWRSGARRSNRQGAQAGSHNTCILYTPLLDTLGTQVQACELCHDHAVWGGKRGGGLYL